EAAVEDGILALAAEDIPRRSLAKWAGLAVEAQALDAQVDAICTRSALEAEPDGALRIAADAVTLGVGGATTETLPKLCDEARASSETMNRIIELIRSVLACAGRDSSAPLDVKAEALAAGFLHVMGQLAPEDARFRSAALADDSVIDELTLADALAGE